MGWPIPPSPSPTCERLNAGEGNPRKRARPHAHLSGRRYYVWPTSRDRASSPTGRLNRPRCARAAGYRRGRCRPSPMRVARTNQGQGESHMRPISPTTPTTPTTPVTPSTANPEATCRTPGPAPDPASEQALEQATGRLTAAARILAQGALRAAAATRARATPTTATAAAALQQRAAKIEVVATAVHGTIPAPTLASTPVPTPAPIPGIAGAAAESAIVTTEQPRTADDTQQQHSSSISKCARARSADLARLRRPVRLQPPDVPGGCTKAPCACVSSLNMQQFCT